MQNNVEATIFNYIIIKSMTRYTITDLSNSVGLGSFTMNKLDSNIVIYHANDSKNIQYFIKATFLKK